MPHPNYSPDLTLGKIFFLLPRMKSVLKGKCFADMEEVKQKNDRSTKWHQNRWVQKLFWAVGKSMLIGRGIAANGEYFERDWSLNM